MLRNVSKFAWCAALLGLFAVGSGALHALHQHPPTGDDRSQFACADDSPSHHSQDGQPCGEQPHRRRAPTHSDDCGVCQLIAAIAKTHIADLAASTVEIKPVQTSILTAVSRRAHTTSYHDPRLTRGPPALS